MSEDTRLLSAQPQIVNLFPQRPLLGLPTDYFNAKHTTWSDDRPLNYAGRFGVRYVLLLCGDDIKKDDEFFGNLEHGTAPDWLKVIERGDRLALCELSTTP